MNKAAQQLGRLAKGVPKTLSPEQREQRRMQLATARKKRWPALKRRRQNAECSDAKRSLPRQVRP